MLLCFRCEGLYADAHSLISHLKCEHGFYPTSKCRLVCSQQHCRKQFSTYAGFRKHLGKIHVPCSVFRPTDSCTQSETVQSELSDEEPHLDDDCVESDPVLSKEDLKDMCASIVAKLQGSGASGSTVSSIICDLEEFTTELHLQTKQDVVRPDSPEPKSFENPFASFNSKAKREKFFSERWGIVQPLEIVLGIRYDNRRNKRTGSYDQVPVKDTFVYIPILDSLKFMFRNTDICKHFESGFDIVVRDKASFEIHCRDIQSDTQLNSVYVIKRDSSLNTLQYFHVCSNFSFDIMHDILEGVAQYELKLLFGYLTEHFISKNDLLSRIYSFDFGYTERRNRPTNVNLEHDGNSIGLNSIQTLCLVRNTPLIFGDLVPPGNPNWNLLLILLHIINIVFSPVVTYGMTVFFKHLISEHHQLFKLVYPQKRLIPKHHFMVHYPSCIRKIGPLLHAWSMRFEAKNKLFKNMLKSFKNITKSLAKKHQMTIGNHWETLSLQQKEFGPMNYFSLSDYENGEDLANALQITVQTDIYSTSWTKLDGTEYRPGLAICTEIKHELPVFCKITNILVLGENVYFVVGKLVTELFSEHCFAFRVVDGNEFNAVVKTDDLKHYKPYNIQNAYGPNEDTYVVPFH